MCMAEALLRIPDSETVDRLIRDKIGHTEWEKRLGSSHGTFVNAGTWALMLGRIVNLENDDRNLGGTFKRLIARTGEPVIRQAVISAMRILGKQFVMGRTLSTKPWNARALRRSTATVIPTTCSAKRHARAMTRCATSSPTPKRSRPSVPPQTVGPRSKAPSISIKLSALHPRYEVANRERVRHRTLASGQGAGAKGQEPQRWIHH